MALKIKSQFYQGIGKLPGTKKNSKYVKKIGYDAWNALNLKPSTKIR